MSTEALDVLIVGAGLSGIGAAYRLQTEQPRARFAILEARDAIGGTWDLFRYPGIRSDSDMFTLAYPFHPWRGANAIADGASILAYLRETAETFGIDRHIRFGHRITSATWSSDDARWTVQATVAGGETKRFSCRFLFVCSGYYSYEEAHAPSFPGAERFRGRIVHPQWWPADLDAEGAAGKRFVVIGSGATAVTLVPALAETAASVTMLQRSPGYIASLPARDRIADFLRGVLPARAAHRIAREKNALRAVAFYGFCRRYPNAARRLFRAQTAKMLPVGSPIDPHFTPSYDPWDQRVCVVPDADLFKAMRRGTASVVTDSIETFTERGVRLASGAELEADVIVTATGLKVVACGGVALDLDGAPVKLADKVLYKGLMLDGVPNFAWCIGYANASWTLRSDLSARYVCRLLAYMDARGHDVAVPAIAPAGEARKPLLALNSGYINRVAHAVPKQGSTGAWRFRQNYLRDMVTMTFGPVDDAMTFSRRPEAQGLAEPLRPTA